MTQRTTQTNELHKELTAMVLIITATTPRKALLLESRKHGFWMPPGGHVELHENPLETAIREVREETGLEVESYLPSATRIDDERTEIPLPMRMLQVHLTHNGKEHYHVDCTYRVVLPEEVPVQHDERESSDIGWFTLDQLDGLNIPADLLPILQSELGSS